MAGAAEGVKRIVNFYVVTALEYFSDYLKNPLGTWNCCHASPSSGGGGKWRIRNKATKKNRARVRTAYLPHPDFHLTSSELHLAVQSLI